MNTKNVLGLNRLTGSHFFTRTLEQHPVVAFFVFVLALKLMHVGLSLDAYVTGGSRNSLDDGKRLEYDSTETLLLGSRLVRDI